MGAKYKDFIKSPELSVKWFSFISMKRKVAKSLKLVFCI